jgi:hypothetical protein
MKYPLLLIAMVLILPCMGQSSSYQVKSSTPQVSTPRAAADPSRVNRYPWKQNITATVFWIGEKPTARNPTSNHASSWDTRWQENYGGYDNPDQAARIQYRPKAFTPKLNPFYVALPYNDCLNYKTHCPHASRVIPWWHQRSDKRLANPRVKAAGFKSSTAKKSVTLNGKIVAHSPPMTGPTYLATSAPKTPKTWLLVWTFPLPYATTSACHPRPKYIGAS